MVSLSGVTSGFTFIPKEDGSEDGYLAGYSYHKRTQMTKLEFIDTTNMTSFAQFNIPQRVPFGN